MSWEIALQTLLAPGRVEYGVFQRDARDGTPLWRRPTRGKRFTLVADALFNRQGALNAIAGNAPYPKIQYAASADLHIAYVAAWLSGSRFAFLARQATPEPEVTIVPVMAVGAIEFDDASALTNHLATIFGESASAYGVRFLSVNREIVER